MLESFLNKAASLKACNFIKKRLQRMYFPVKFGEFLRTPILKNTANYGFCSFSWHLCWSLLIKLQLFRPVTLLKRDSNRGVFL